MGLLLCALLALELLLAATQLLATRAPICKRGRQLIAAQVAQLGVLARVRLGGLRQHPLDLGADRRVAARRGRRSVTRQQAAVERNQSDRHQSGPRTKRQHLLEGVGQRLLVASTKAGDRGVIGHPVRCQHPKGDILATATLDPTARALPRSHTHRATARPSSAGRRRHDPSRPGDRPRRRARGPSPRPRRSQTRPGDRLAATRAGSGAATAPGRGRTR
jgi:hypothetical protein